jgi:hypothetical protein
VILGIDVSARSPKIGQLRSQHPSRVSVIATVPGPLLDRPVFDLVIRCEEGSTPCSLANYPISYVLGRLLSSNKRSCILSFLIFIPTGSRMSSALPLRVSMRAIQPPHDDNGQVWLNPPISSERNATLVNWTLP